MIEKILMNIINDINNIQGKDILTEAVKNKLNKSLILYDINTNIDLDTEEYNEVLKILVDKVG